MYLLKIYVVQKIDILQSNITDYINKYQKIFNFVICNFTINKAWLGKVKSHILYDWTENMVLKSKNQK